METPWHILRVPLFTVSLATGPRVRCLPDRRLVFWAAPFAAGTVMAIARKKEATGNLIVAPSKPEFGDVAAAL